ncbi:MAG: epimerase [Bacteroidia bacterium]
MNKIGIIGCGWLGIRLVQHLKEGDEIYTTIRSEDKKEELISKGFNPIIVSFSDEVLQDFKDLKQFAELDLIIITVPFSKSANINLLKNRFENISLFLGKFEKQIFLMSSIGIYPQIEQEIAEDNIPEEQLNQSILFVEKLMKDHYPQLNILRLAGLMGDDRVFSKYATQSTNQIVNHVHYNDICNVIEEMINLKTHSKTYNIVAPKHPTKFEIINYQKNNILKNDDNENKSLGRKILSKKSELELNYIYKHPNPILFK